MAVNYATKYEKATSDLLVARRKSSKFTNQDWDWDGNESIVVTTLTDPTIGNYNPNVATGAYGEPSEVEDTEQTFTLSRDRAWTKTIDKKSIQDKLGIKRPAKYLAQVTKNKMVPEIDTYIFQTIATAGALDNRDDIVSDGATSSSNAYTNFSDINADITDQEAPEEGRVAAMTPGYYNKLKQTTVFDSSDTGLADRKKGSIGKLDGVEIVVVPSNRMPANTDLIISHPMVCVSPEKLKDYKVHDNPPGKSGYLIEYRHRYDAFVDANLYGCIGIHKTA